MPNSRDLAARHPRGWRRSAERVPGIDGAMTVNASAGSAPCAPGSHRRGRTSRYSRNDPGQPCVRSNGNGLGRDLPCGAHAVSDPRSRHAADVAHRVGVEKRRCQSHASPPREPPASRRAHLAPTPIRGQLRRGSRSTAGGARPVHWELFDSAPQQSAAPCAHPQATSSHAGATLLLVACLSFELTG
jgi:hypothetical protein